MLPYVPKQNLPPQSIGVWWDCGLQRSQRWTQLHKSMWLKPTLPTIRFFSVILQGFLAQKSIWTIKPHGFQYKHIHNKHTCTVTQSLSQWTETMFIISLFYHWCRILSVWSFAVSKGCSPSSYKCASGKCLTKINPECDGIKDCKDGSDELRCGERLKNDIFTSI